MTASAEATIPSSVEGCMRPPTYLTPVWQAKLLTGEGLIPHQLHDHVGSSAYLICCYRVNSLVGNVSIVLTAPSDRGNNETVS